MIKQLLSTIIWTLIVTSDRNSQMLAQAPVGSSVDRFDGLRRVAQEKEAQWQDLQKKLSNALLTGGTLTCDGSVEAQIQSVQVAATQSYNKWREYYQDSVTLATQRLKGIAGEISGLKSLREAKLQLSNEEDQVLVDLQRRKANLDETLKTGGISPETPSRPLQELIDRSAQRRQSTEKLLSEIDSAAQSYKGIHAILSRNLEIAKDHVEFTRLELSVWQTFYKARRARVDLDCAGREKLFERKPTLPKPELR